MRPIALYLCGVASVLLATSLIHLAIVALVPTESIGNRLYRRRLVNRASALLVLSIAVLAAGVAYIAFYQGSL